MKVLIDIPDQDVDLLSKWASVMRTINTAKEACDEASLNTKDEALAEKCNNCHGELADIGPALDRLHYAVRSEIWQQQKGTKKKLLLSVELDDKELRTLRDNSLQRWLSSVRQVLQGKSVAGHIDRNTCLYELEELFPVASALWYCGSSAASVV